MNPQSMFSIRHWKLTNILFVGAALFAMAAIGFFLAVYIQLHLSGSTAQDSAQSQTQNGSDVSVEGKAALLKQLSESAPQTDTSSKTSVKSPAEQAQEDAAIADQKLKLLQQLKTQ